MKELSIEEKAVRFPEHKESNEDEKIRKLLVEAVIQVLQDQYCSNRGVSKEKVVAWLEKQGKQGSLNANQECLKGIKRVQAYQDLSDWEKKFDNIASMYAHNKNQEGYNNSCYVKERAAAMLYHAKKELEKQVTPQTRTGDEWVNMIDDACDKRYSEEYARGEYCHEQSFKWGFQEGVEWLEKQDEQSSVIRWYDASLIPQENGELLVEWNGNDAAWHEIAFYHADTKTFWNGERHVENVTRWCYIDDLLEKQRKKVEPIGDFNSEFERQVSRLIASIINKEHEYTEAFVKWVSNALLNYAKHEINKQGEQKPILNFNANDWYVSKTDSKIHNMHHLVDKIEPKFKVGDWIYHEISGNAFHINRIENRTYISDEGATISFGRQNDWRLWTISDAKDGDVLTNGEIILIFKQFEEPSYRQHIIAYVGLDISSNIQVTDGYWQLGIDKTSLATKEQRDQLEKAMADARYIFDFEKKELKKISQEHPLTTDELQMKVFACRNQGGGLILVAANTRKEAYLTAAMDGRYEYMFNWADDNGMWCEPDGNIDHCTSYTYPLESWFEVKHLSTDLTEAKVIIEESSE